MNFTLPNHVEQYCLSGMPVKELNFSMKTSGLLVNQQRFELDITIYWSTGVRVTAVCSVPEVWLPAGDCSLYHHVQNNFGGLRKFDFKDAFLSEVPISCLASASAVFGWFLCLFANISWNLLFEFICPKFITAEIDSIFN